MTTTNCHSNESREARDNRIAAIINSERGPRTPEQKAECDLWLQERIAVARAAHRLWPAPATHDGGDFVAPDGELHSAKRLEFIRKRIGTGNWYSKATITEADAATMADLYRSGVEQQDIAKRFGIAQASVSRIIRRHNLRARGRKQSHV